MTDLPKFDHVQRKARDWWAELQPSRHDQPTTKPNGEKAKPKGDPAALARLRRAAIVAEAMAEEATHDLYCRLGLPVELHKVERWLPRVAVIAHVLAYVREDVTIGEAGARPPLAIQAVGRKSPEDKDSATMGPLRLRRLLAARGDEDLMIQMRRLVALADRRINVGDLAASLLYWNDRIRARWAFAYYGAGLAVPAAETTSPDQED